MMGRFMVFIPIIVLILIILILVVMEALQPWIDTKSLRESSFLYNAFDKFVNNVSSTFLEHI